MLILTKTKIYYVNVVFKESEFFFSWHPRATGFKLVGSSLAFRKENCNFSDDIKTLMNIHFTLSMFFLEQKHDKTGFFIIIILDLVSVLF